MPGLSNDPANGEDDLARTPGLSNDPANGEDDLARTPGLVDNPANEENDPACTPGHSNNPPQALASNPNANTPRAGSSSSGDTNGGGEPLSPTNEAMTTPDESNPLRSTESTTRSVTSPEWLSHALKRLRMAMATEQQQVQPVSGATSRKRAMADEKENRTSGKQTKQRQRGTPEDPPPKVRSIATRRSSQKAASVASPHSTRSAVNRRTSRK
ncbi:hypothetical protein EYR36_002380 [Pleurotus pulmonarius]|nr:hypothetical protein EYR36_002380 [Pleurotus pulmonarius]